MVRKNPSQAVIPAGRRLADQAVRPGQNAAPERNGWSVGSKSYQPRPSRRRLASGRQHPGPGGGLQVLVDLGAQLLPLRIVGPVPPVFQGFPGAEHQVVVGIIHPVQGLAADVAGLLHGLDPELAQQTHDITHVLSSNRPFHQHLDHVVSPLGERG